MQHSRAASSPAATPNRTRALMREAVEVVLLVAVIFFGIRLSIESRPIDGSSMFPGLHDKQNVLVNKLAYVFGKPQRGDVIIFYYPLQPDEEHVFIKRVIGLPGDMITLTPTTVAVNGHVLQEPYIQAPINSGVSTQPVKLGPNEYWAMGDNRPNSDDSRYWGVLNRKYIIGQAEFVWWPTNAIKMIPTYRPIYTSVAGRPTTPNDAPLAALTLAPLAALGLRRSKNRWFSRAA